MPPKAKKSKSKTSKKPRKNKKSKKGKKKIDKNLIFCDDKHFDPKLAIISVEHCLKCPIFREMSTKIFQQICGAFPERKFKHIQNDFDRAEPREGAFELSVARNCRLPARLVWSGLERGPPRREKVPMDLSLILEQIGKEIVDPEENKLAALGL